LALPGDVVIKATDSKTPASRKNLITIGISYENVILHSPLISTNCC
jgi:hypothetical protein